MYRECTNCEYGRGLGSDVYCGHDPKGKETYMATKDTDCVYWKADKWTRDESVLERGMRLSPKASFIKDEDTEVTINSFVSEDIIKLLYLIARQTKGYTKEEIRYLDDLEKKLFEEED